MFTNLPFVITPEIGEVLSDVASARRKAQYRAVLIAAAAFVIFLMFKKLRKRRA